MKNHQPFKGINQSYSQSSQPTGPNNFKNYGVFLSIILLILIGNTSSNVESRHNVECDINLGATVLNANLTDQATSMLFLGDVVRRDYLSSSEPKSTHTILGSNKTQIYNYDIDVRITNFPSNPGRKWLYFFAIQVNFTGHDEWSHGGLQWANSQEYVNSNNQGVNWGGGSDWAGYGGIGRTNTPYIWKTGKWYRYRVWRMDKGKDGLWRWLFTVLDYETGKERQLGTVVTKSEWIKNAFVWMETGYGVQCDTPPATVQWRNPTFKCTAGTFVPNQGTASYNGTCSSNRNTNQGIISTNPLTWFQTTNAARTVPMNQRLW